MNTQITLIEKTYFPKSALIHLPADYQTSNKSYPLIFYIGGTGEAESISRQTAFGPSALVLAGNKMEFAVNAVAETPIVVSVATGLWPQPEIIDMLIEDIFTKYRADRKRLILTGLSMGAGALAAYSSDPRYSKKVSALYALQGVQTSDTLMAINYAANGGKLWAVEGKDDWRGWSLVVDAMNKKAPGSAEYTLVSSGRGTTHCCWDRFYALDFLNKFGDNWIVWALKQSQAAIVVPPPPPPVVKKEVVTLKIELSTGPLTVTVYDDKTAIVS